MALGHFRHRHQGNGRVGQGLRIRPIAVAVLARVLVITSGPLAQIGKGNVGEQTADIVGLQVEALRRRPSSNQDDRPEK
jgi:hypothetical protein